MTETSEFSFIASLDPLALCGEDARQWLDEFRAEESWQVAKNAFQAMVCFRRHDLDGACELLRSASEQLAALHGASPSVIHLLRRWQLSAMAYFHYLNGDLAGAIEHLMSAHDEVRAALSRDPFLLPFATHCTDFRIQMARIARRQNRWADAQEQIDSLRRIYADLEPFCTLEDGTDVRLSDIRRFYEALPLDEQQREKLRFALDEDFPHSHWLDRLEEQVFALPDFVIPYP
jgi:hypothetical protein